MNGTKVGETVLNVADSSVATAFAFAAAFLLALPLAFFLDNIALQLLIGRACLGSGESQGHGQRNQTCMLKCSTVINFSSDVAVLMDEGVWYPGEVVGDTTFEDLDDEDLPDDNERLMSSQG